MPTLQHKIIAGLITAGLVGAVLALTGCNENTGVLKRGGKMQIDLPFGQKLVNVTWKEGDSLWILTRPMREAGKTTRSAPLFDDFAETYTFQEKSAYGMVEGTVIIVEHGGQ